MQVPIRAMDMLGPPSCSTLEPPGKPPIIHQGNANKTEMRYHLTPISMGKIKKEKITNVGQGVRK